ncbi:hypothetical protein [Glaciibacter superstes]|uniref:hypothetical protein n=1 Tax=Glaciibacter superstes TaxID=501023 RepID=UPI0003B5875A|nr:hypothetical protein [Glaciibacter superstes]
MSWNSFFNENNFRIAETERLIAYGATWRSMKAAVELGQLVRARRGHYALPGTDPHTLEAVRLGGRLGCISAAADYGVFALDNTFVHIQVQPTASRLRAPHDRFQRLTDHNRHGAELHWDELLHPEDGNEYRVGLTDALVQTFRCQQPRFALASLDNAMHQNLIRPDEVNEIFAALPRELQYLRARVDARSDSGQETVLSFIVHEAGYKFEIQVRIDGVGRVDMVIEGCLVVEADSREFHQDWAAQKRDRTRDRDLARAQYVSYRAIHEDILYHPEIVLEAIAGLLAVNRNYNPANK